MNLPISFSHTRITTRSELCARAATRATGMSRDRLQRSEHRHAVVKLSEFQIVRKGTEALFVVWAISASRICCCTKPLKFEWPLSRRGLPLAPVLIPPINKSNHHFVSAWNTGRITIKITFKHCSVLLSNAT
jgi:hypothetical protein